MMAHHDIELIRSYASARREYLGDFDALMAETSLEVISFASRTFPNKKDVSYEQGCRKLMENEFTEDLKPLVIRDLRASIIWMRAGWSYMNRAYIGLVEELKLKVK